MKRTSALVCVAFCAGLLGAAASAATAWLLVYGGLEDVAGVNLQAALGTGDLARHLLRGGLWGLAYALTVAHVRTRRHWVRKGMIVSVLPSLYQLLVVFPYQTAAGTLGMQLGVLMPLFVVLLNLVWGAFTGVFTRLLWGKS